MHRDAAAGGIMMALRKRAPTAHTEGCSRIDPNESSGW
jgi:hypothetical protein